MHNLSQKNKPRGVHRAFRWRAAVFTTAPVLWNNNIHLRKDRCDTPMMTDIFHWTRVNIIKDQAPPSIILAKHDVKPLRWWQISPIGNLANATQKRGVWPRWNRPGRPDLFLTGAVERYYSRLRPGLIDDRSQKHIFYKGIGVTLTRAPAQLIRLRRFLNPGSLVREWIEFVKRAISAVIIAVITLILLVYDTR